MIVDCAVYDAGERQPEPVPLEHACEAGREPDRFVWIRLSRPTEGDLEAVRREFGLHELAVEDAIKAHQRPKLELYGETFLLVLKTARYVDPHEIVELGEILLFLGRGFVISVTHGAEREVDAIREQLEAERQRLRAGPAAVVHAIVDGVVDAYLPVIAGVDEDVRAVEEDVFGTARTNPAARIYRLRREVLAFHRAVAPLVDPLDRIVHGANDLIPVAVRAYFRDVEDHLLRVVEQVASVDALLNSMLDANMAQVTMQQNEDMRRISAWVAIVAVPTLIAGIYGMNFEHMPELSWRFGYWYALGVMGALCLLLWVLFRRSRWL